MGAVSNYRRSGSLVLKPLLTQFIHDSRTDVLKFSAGQWNFNRTGSGDPFRNADVVTVPAITTEASIDFRFTSAGRSNEWVALHMPIDSNVLFKIYLNNELVIERDTPGDTFLNYGPRIKKPFETTPLWNGDPYAYPSCILQPTSGVNQLRFVNLPRPSGTSGANLYFDGISLSVHGDALPI